MAVNFQYGAPLDDKMTLKSRPESNPTPQLINTGPFATNRAISVGAEMYFNIGQFMIGSEVAQHNFYYPGNDHHFNGGDLLLSYIFTGAHRPYKTDGNIYGFVPVKKSVFKGGLGEIEGVLRFSTFDLNDKELYGGKFTRITPMINWYLTSVVRCEFIYGYGIMERFGLTGKVSFFETRLQLSIL
jgi:phosphate-selective porin OprO/OprP